jgi:hypothetical protein
MTKTTEPVKPPGLALLREPFPPNQISKLPKESKKQREEREADRSKGVSCTVCGGWHHKNAVHLDYVGHAALTDRLLDVDPNWGWEPVAFRDGLPAFDQTGGLWIKLTVCGVTRLGYGHAAAKPQMDPGAREKEVIGDALRNAAMRFGAALDLWHKGDLHAHENDDPEPEQRKPVQPTVDTSPKARAKRITEGVKQGDAENAAAAMAQWEKPLLDAVWALLDAATQDKLTAAWPVAEPA